MILFLGSGISLASGLPSVADIQRELLVNNPNFRLKELFLKLNELDTNYLERSAPFIQQSGEVGFGDCQDSCRLFFIS